uniref:BACK domain-containing protein n=1 Tax=Syphacia muris TaxID=451379 RepID=A0A158R4S6_9BILA
MFIILRVSNGDMESFFRADAVVKFGDQGEPEIFLQCHNLLTKILTRKYMPTISVINLQKAMQMFDVASYLLLDPILDVLTNLITSLITVDTIIEVFRFSKDRHIPLANSIWKRMIRDFEELQNTGNFFKFEEEELIELLKDPSVDFTRMKVNTIIRDWLQNKAETENAEKPRLLRVWLHNYNDAYCENLREPIPHIVLLATGGFINGPTDVIEAYDRNNQEWVVANARLKHPNMYHCAINTGDDMYFVGGSDGIESRNATRRYNFETRKSSDSAWMYNRRCFLMGGLLDKQHVIAIGGYNGFTRLTSAEIFDVEANQWKLTANMETRRSDGGCAVINGIPYAVGGFDGTQCYKTVEYYEAEYNRWISMRPMRRKRSGVGVVALHGAIFVCGGFDGLIRQNTSELYDPREGRWHTMQSMKLNRSNFGIEFFDKRVMVCGGFMQDQWNRGTVEFCECYDIRANSWHQMAPLNHARSALKLAIVDHHETITAMFKSRIQSSFA